MIQRMASTTMVRSAILRAEHQIIDATPKILEDPLAVGLVEGSSREEILATPPHMRVPGWFRAGFVLRSRFAEDCLREAVAAGVRQYVLLGAGLDTFACRQPAWAASLHICEVDHPESQDFKRACLRKRNIAIPNNVEFCPVDFEHDSLAAGLAASTLDLSAPTFFAWLGVTQYLTREAIDATLRQLVVMPRGSEIVLTLRFEPGSQPPEEREFLAQVEASAARRGEPWLSQFDAEKAHAYLAELGFSRVFQLTSEEAAARYFGDRTDDLRPPSIGLFHAVV